MREGRELLHFICAGTTDARSLVHCVPYRPTAGQCVREIFFSFVKKSVHLQHIRKKNVYVSLENVAENNFSICHINSAV
jgi:hypothetical protein